MQMLLEAQGSEIWNAVKNGLHIPNAVVNGASTQKP